MDLPGDIYALVWGARLLQRRGATGFAVSVGHSPDYEKILIRLTTRLDDEDRHLMSTAGWTSQAEAEGEHWLLDVDGLHDAANALPLRNLVLNEEAQERDDFGPVGPPPPKDADSDYMPPRGEGIDESGWRRVGRYDSARRRALWARVVLAGPNRNVIHDDDVRHIELCSGREGDDAYVKLGPETPGWSALIDVILRAIDAADDADDETKHLHETSAHGKIRETPLLRKHCVCGWQVPRQFVFNVRNDSDEAARFHVSLEFACPQCGSTDLLAEADAEARS